jgi:putative FmdB family regulatory protein
MPLYEYQCETCEHRFEKIQKFTDPPPDCCPKCGGPVRKLFSSPAIQFKGTGFYITDYAKKSSDGGQADSSEKSGSSEKQQDKKDKSESGAGKSDSGSTKADSGSSGKSDSGSSSSGDSAPASTTKPKT